MKHEFERIYADNEWKYGSGEGSLPVHTAPYRCFIENFIKEHKIESVVDFGCGDWQSSRLIDWEGVKYIGFDIVPSVIEENRVRYSRPNVEFRIFKDQFSELPITDLLIVKDVLQHWSNEAIQRFLPYVKRYRFALITNCVKPFGPTVNGDIRDGDFRYLDLCSAPFNLEAEEVVTFTNHRSILEKLWPRPRWKKKVLLSKGGDGVV